MATIQPKISRGHKYWYIVESRRVNGKPRPIVLAYLGKAENLLKRLKGVRIGLKVKSYAHGAVAALLGIAQKLQVPSIINKYVESARPYMSKKPIRNNLTVGMTILLGAIGRICMPTSKRGWREWAKGTSIEYLLRCSLSRIDSQHFWDLMDAMPISAISKIETELLQIMKAIYPIEHDTLMFDTTNFFTFIATTNIRCTIAQRGKNKQKRNDLRQVGLALVVTRSDSIPIFHLTYQGNRNDAKVFANLISSIKQRLIALGFDAQKHTLVFDRGNNSKSNMALVSEAGLHYVGALTPYQHQGLLERAAGNYQCVELEGKPINVYRSREQIWGEDRAVLVFVSERLKAGQLRGVYQNLRKKEKALRKLQQSLSTARGSTKDKEALHKRVSGMLKGQFLQGLIRYWITEDDAGNWHLDFCIDQKNIEALEDKLGLRILMTDRHEWSTVDIINAYYRQADVEQAFKNIKNPYHLGIRPQFHWTDQKISVHFFMCVLGYLLSSILLKEARSKAKFGGTIDSLLDRLNSIRLAALIEESISRGRPKAVYKPEEMSQEDRLLFHTLDLDSMHLRRPQIKGVGVYE